MLDKLLKYKKEKGYSYFDLALEIGLSEYPVYKYCNPKYYKTTDRCKKIIENFIKENC